MRLNSATITQLYSKELLFKQPGQLFKTCLKCATIFMFHFYNNGSFFLKSLDGKSKPELKLFWCALCRTDVLLDT